MAKLFSFVLPLDIYSLGLITMITMVDERYNHRDYGEHVASKSDDENMKSGRVERGQAASVGYSRACVWVSPSVP